MKYGVYKWSCDSRPKIYVGRSFGNFSGRYSEHEGSFNKQKADLA